MTSQSPLDRLAGPAGVLSKEPRDANEFAGLVQSGLARLTDAEKTSNSLYSRFDLAYSDRNKGEAAWQTSGLNYVDA